jgi:hypothetical protein
MNGKTCLAVHLALLAGIILSACGPQNAPAAAPQSWIDAPLHNSTIPLAPYQVVAHAAFPTGISQFELSITGQAAEIVPAPADQAGQTLVYMTHAWNPPAPGAYLIQVRAAGPDGTYGQMVEAQVHVGEVPQEVTPTPSVPAPQVCIWTAAVNIFVRQGPGASIYPEITAVEAGTMFPVAGQSQDQQFWAVQLQNGQSGYVPKAEQFGQASGDCNVPILPDPPPPTPTSAPPTEPPTPAPPQCSDGIDNDGDGGIDFRPAGIVGGGDRQCTSPDDNDESS